MTLTQMIAFTLYMEAGSEPFAGKMAVASVIWQRAHGNIDEIEEVILAPKQFSCWNHTQEGVSGIGPRWDTCLKIAESMITGTFEPTIQADHYYNPTLCAPRWAKGMSEVAVIGGHRFMRGES